MAGSNALPSPDRRARVRLAALLAAAALVVASCSSDGSDGASSTTTTDGAAAATTTTAAGSMGGTDPVADDPADGHECDAGSSSEGSVSAEPVPGVGSDLTVTSFDGTPIRAHWFPLDGASADEPAPSVLMGPGWSLSGDTSLGEQPAPFGLLSISALHDEGYSVLTWDPRGFGESGGQAQVNSPDAEGRDVQVLLDWLAEQPQALLDDDGDPRAGMVGGSYGGGIQLTVAAIDCRIDAIVPNMAWHSLETALYENETVKEGWASNLVEVAAAGNLDPHIVSANESGSTDGTLSAEDEQWFRERGPGDLVDQITTPTFLVQGTVDTLFPLDEATAIYSSLRERDVPVAMAWYCGGHGVCMVDEGDTELPAEATRAWLARFLGADESIDTGPRFTTVDQEGETWAAGDLPEATEELTGSGAGTLGLTADSVAGPITLGEGEGGLLGGLVADITPAPATGPTVEVPIDAGDVDGLALGAPKLSLAYSGTVPDGTNPVRVFAQLVDPELNVVVGNQITPVPLVLDGTDQTVEIDLETIAQRIRPGASLTLQLVATTPAYVAPRLGGEVTFADISVVIPVVTSMTPSGGGDVR